MHAVNCQRDTSTFILLADCSNTKQYSLRHFGLFGFLKVFEIKPKNLLQPLLFLIKRIWMNEWMNDCLKPELSVHLSDCNFAVQRLLLGLGVLTSQLRCYVHSIVCHICVGLRFDMPLIKRILIDWLIDWFMCVPVCVCAQAPYEGSGMNPARSFGSAVISGYLNDNVRTHAVSID